MIENCYAVALRLVTEHFEGDRVKAELWMETDNPLLGGMTPWEMIVVGRGRSLLDFIRHSLSENRKPKGQET